MLYRLGEGTSAQVGGKAAGLNRLIAADFPVPDGFVVGTAAYRLSLAPAGLLWPGHGLDETARRAAIAEVELPEAVRAGIAREYARMGSPAVAVRSSATAEDLAGLAFAGQQDTFVNVRGVDAVLDAVRGCWASLWSERAVDYRRHHGVDESTLAMAVVVQRMVPAVTAGVMFTANPVTGERRQAVIEGSAGLGGAVVDGTVTPERMVLDPLGTIVEHRRGSVELRLPDRPLFRLSRQLRRTFAEPVDVEWAFDGAVCWLLQARPMTALPPAPLLLSGSRRTYGRVLLELLPARPYPMDVTAWIRPGMGPLLSSMADGLAGIEINLADCLRERHEVVDAVVPPRLSPTRRTPIKLAMSLVRAQRYPLREWPRDVLLRRYLFRLAVLRGADLEALSWPQLLVHLQQVLDQLRQITNVRVRYLPAAGVALVRLFLLLRVLGLQRLGTDLLASHDTQTRRANDALAELGRLQGEEFESALAGFMEWFGHRETTSLLYVSSPTWGESPELVRQLARGMAPTDARGVPDVRADARLRAQAELLSHRWLRGAKTKAVARRWVRAAGAAAAFREDSHFHVTRPIPLMRAALLEAARRLVAAGAIDRVEDVWHLRLAELQGLGSATDDATPPLRQRVARRARRRAELGGSPLISPLTLYPDLLQDDRGVVVGTGAGGGQAAGVVRIVRTPEEFARLQAGEVLVCPATSPAWTPLFQRAAAVVVDNGGLASHAAIVAREYGIPAVMGTGNATTALSDGLSVVVDGDRGVVMQA